MAGGASGSDGAGARLVSWSDVEQVLGGSGLDEHERSLLLERLRRCALRLGARAAALPPDGPVTPDAFAAALDDLDGDDAAASADADAAGGGRRGGAGRR